MEDDLTDAEAETLFERTQHIGNAIHVLAQAELIVAEAVNDLR